MSAVAAFLVFMTLTVWTACAAVEPEDSVFAFRSTLLAWLVLSALIVAANLILPFTGTGDDASYFDLVSQRAGSITTLLDPTRFIGLMEQSGYPWILSIVTGLFGSNLLALKFLNLAVYILISVVWYRIGVLLEGPDLGRRLLICTLLTCPLWFYFFFLLKDLPIVLLESLFLQGMVTVWRGGTLRGWLTITIVSVVTLMFRAPLVLQYIAIAGISIAVQMSSSSNQVVRWRTVAVGVVVITAILALGSNPDFLNLLGIYAKTRVLGSEGIFDQGLELGKESLIQRSIFPILYLLSETAGFSASTWRNLDAALIRGILALPWIAFVVPLFLLGLPWLWAIPAAGRDSTRAATGRLTERRLIATPWSVISIYIASSIAISWVVGDTTRWRLADMPAIIAVSVCAWKSRPVYASIIAVAAWLMMVAVSVTLYYFARSHQYLTP